MKILFDLTSLYDHITGIERYAMEISWHMIKACPRNNYVLVFKNEIHSRYSEFVNSDNVRMVVIKGKNKLFFSQVTLLNKINKIKADAYMFLAFPSPILFFKKNRYVAVHDMTPWECGRDMTFLSRWYYRISELRAFKGARRIITISRFSVSRIMELAHIPGNRIWLIYCGTISDEYATGNTNLLKESKRSVNNVGTALREKYHLPERYILTLSTLEPRKNLSLLIDAYSQLLEQGINMPPLVLAGRNGWKLSELTDKITKKVSDNILFTGYVEDAELPELYREAEFFVFPSKYEGFGMPPLDALKCGTTVLASDAASMPEVLKDAAVYFKSGSRANLMIRLKEMMEMKSEERQERIDKGEEVCKCYSWEREAVKLERKLSLEKKKCRLGENEKNSY